MKKKTLDKDTIVAYHNFVQERIRNDLNSLAIGPAWLPCRLALTIGIMAGLCLITGILVVALRHRHVYLIDWWAQFTGPVFIILFFLLAGLATWLLVVAKRRANRYRRELFFRPIGDFGVAVVHKSNLQFEQEIKPELKSGTTPHRGVLPSTAAYSERNRRHREGQDNRGYDRRQDDMEQRRERRDDRDRRPRDPRDDRDRRPRDPRDDRDRRPRDPRDDRDRRPRDPRERDPRDDRERRERRERDPRDDRERRERDPRDDRERRERDPRDDRDRRERRERDPREQERQDPREREDRERRIAQKEREAMASHPAEGRKTGRGAPKLPADSSGFVPPDRVMLDADFGHPAGLDSSSRASESEL